MNMNLKCKVYLYSRPKHYDFMILTVQNQSGMLMLA